MSIKSPVAAETSWFQPHRLAPLLAGLIGFLAYLPFVFLRYEYHDSWAWLYWLNALRSLDINMSCLELGGHHEQMGKPLMTGLLCALTAMGPVLDRVWVPKFLAFSALMGSGYLLVATFRRVGANPWVASATVLGLLLLPGTVLIVVWLATNPIAIAAFASVVAGHVWLRYLRHPIESTKVRLTLSVSVFFLILAAMFTYQIVALGFFLPLLIELLFSKQETNIRQFVFPVLAVATFALAAVCYIVVHKILLYEFHYFFLSEHHVRSAAGNDRNVAFVNLGEIGEKLRYFLVTLLPRVLSLWFVSPDTDINPPAVAIVGTATVAALVIFVWQSKNVWRSLSLVMIVCAFFVPFLISSNIGNGLYTNERVKVFMQLPIVFLLFWIIQFSITYFPGRSVLRNVGILLTAMTVLGMATSWLVILRVRVIPTYMEVLHVENRLRTAVQQNARQIVIIKAEDRHLRATLGNRASDEFGRITSYYFPQNMVSALLLEIEKKKLERAVIAIEPEKADTIAPAPNRFILDMRRFP